MSTVSLMVIRRIAAASVLGFAFGCEQPEAAPAPAPAPSQLEKTAAPVDPPQPSEAAPVRIAAAADLTNAFDELGKAFETKTGHKVTFSFGSTGLLAKQLAEGAPFDVFAAANVSFVDDVVKAGVCDGSTKASYARGRIAIWTKQGGVKAPAAISDLRDARFKRIGIANPEHAPYGQAAKDALEHEQLWTPLQPRFVFGDNIRQTFQFAETGNVEAAFVALSLVVNDKTNPWLLVDEKLHRPIEQALVVCTRGSAKAGGVAFAEYVSSAEGRALMRRYGFLLPTEQLAP